MDSSGLDPRTADARSGGPGVSALRLLRSPVPLDCYELRGVIAEGSTAIVYLGTDQYMPWGADLARCQVARRAAVPGAGEGSEPVVVTRRVARCLRRFGTSQSGC